MIVKETASKILKFGDFKNVHCWWLRIKSYDMYENLSRRNYSTATRFNKKLLSVQRQQ